MCSSCSSSLRAPMQPLQTASSSCTSSQHHATGFKCRCVPSAGQLRPRAEWHSTLSALPTTSCILTIHLALQVKSAVTEYRANDIIAIGLRDHITRLQQELRDSQNVCSHQVISTGTSKLTSDTCYFFAASSGLTGACTECPVSIKINLSYMCAGF